ncbi:YihY/virulence factor BrkB family protein [Streptomyces goshikiensis]|uniref:YhjD/YihY/BrkB family envelope integrity protein n=2 Tax=Streptomyces TaxID=1883 RepID=UPI00386E91C0|nr:YihY/virulence factor BrkB family protein [Streptomyces goshikiensis]
MPRSFAVRRSGMPPPAASPNLDAHEGDRHDDDPAPAASAARLRGPLMPSERKARWRERSRELAAAGKRLQGRAETRFPVITHATERMVGVNIFDSATRLAAQCFLTAVPLLFVLASFAPDAVRMQLVDSIRAMFGLTGQASSQLSDVLDGSAEDDLRNAVGVTGAVIVLLSATAVSRAMQRLCRRAWEIPRTGTRIAIWRWFAWIAAWMVLLIIQGPVRDGFGLGLWLGIPLTFLFQTAVWWWSQHLLLGGVIPWLPLLPGAVLTAIAITALSLGARVYMPIALNRSLAAYGSTGSVFVILSWLIVLCVAVAIGISTGAAVAQEPYLARRLGSPLPNRLRQPPL